ncbi:hypothetical protein B0H13DRAFT_1856493 [Mycena leptocephala]|nr:hypothetical protein B0H13DRAFT_1856493 [Mycena leptocephala]
MAGGGVSSATGSRLPNKRRLNGGDFVDGRPETSRADRTPLVGIAHARQMDDGRSSTQPAASVMQENTVINSVQRQTMPRIDQNPSHDPRVVDKNVGRLLRTQWPATFMEQVAAGDDEPTECESCFVCGSHQPSVHGWRRLLSAVQDAVAGNAGVAYQPAVSAGPAPTRVAVPPRTSICASVSHSAPSPPRMSRDALGSIDSIVSMIREEWLARWRNALTTWALFGMNLAQQGPNYLSTHSVMFVLTLRTDMAEQGPTKAFCLMSARILEDKSEVRDEKESKALNVYVRMHEVVWRWLLDWALIGQVVDKDQLLRARTFQRLLGAAVTAAGSERVPTATHPQNKSNDPAPAWSKFKPHRLQR